MREVFRPVFGRALTIVIGLICASMMVALLATDGSSALWAAGPWLALAAVACWAAFWRPEVVVEDSGVRLVNVFRTIELSWPSIRDVDTKWALTLDTAYGSFTAWAAPAPGRHAAARAGRHDLRALPPSQRQPEGLRPGDLPTSDSGSAALLIRRRWEQLRLAGHLDDPRLEHDRAAITWHRGAIAGVVLLAVAAAAGVFL